MKSLKLIIPIVLTFFLVNSALSQNKFYGTVIEVIDGRTLIVEPQAKVNIKIELQYIEVPEVEQALHDVVKTHLKNMVLNKYVEFIPKNLNNEKPVGKILLNGVDISQQMIRDGAAWYNITEKNIQDATESIQYQSNEALAKAEKRGVWGVEGLKPAWEFRAEKEEKIRQEELRQKREEQALLDKISDEKRAKAKAQAEAQRIARANASQYYGLNAGSKLGIEAWQDSSVSGMEKKSGFPNLLTKYIPQYEIEYTLTQANFGSFKAGKTQLKIEGRSLHIKKDNVPINLKDVFGIGFLTSSEKGTFAESNDLTIYADKEAIKIGKAYRFHQEIGGLVKELLLYQIGEEQLATISKAKIVQYKIGDYSGGFDKNYNQMMKDLIKSAE